MTRPKRIVSLLPSATEILYGLGLGDAVVGVSHECDYPADAASKRRVTLSRIDSRRPSSEIDDVVRSLSQEGSALYEVNENALVELQPDLVVTQTQCDVCAVRYQDVVELLRRHSSLRETKLVALNPRSLDEVFRDIASVAEAADRREAAVTFVESLKTRVEFVRASTEDVNRRPRVACIEWIEPLMVAANWMPELVELAAGQHELTTSGKHSGYTEWQTVLDYDPEVVVVMPCGFDLARSINEAQALAAMPGWGNLSAIRSGRVYAVDANAYFNRSGPRLVDSLELLAHLLHPSAMALPPHLSSAWQAVAAPAA